MLKKCSTSLQLVRVSSFRNDLLQNPYFKPDPIYETLFSGANGRPARTVGTQVGLVSSENLGYGGNFENNSNEEELTFTLLNSFWFMIASLLQQGTDLLPR